MRYYSRDLTLVFSSINACIKYPLISLAGILCYIMENYKNQKESITIRQAIDIYLNWKRSHRIAASNKYRVRLLKFADYLAQKTVFKLQDIHPNDIANFHIAMQENYSNATIAYSARILKNFFDFHKGRGNATINPKEIIPIRYVSAEKDVVDEEDFEILSALLDDNDLGDLQKKLQKRRTNTTWLHGEAVPMN